MCSHGACVRVESGTASAIIVYEQVGVCVALVGVPVWECVWGGVGECVKNCKPRKYDLEHQTREPFPWREHDLVYFPHFAERVFPTVNRKQLAKMKISGCTWWREMSETNLSLILHTEINFSFSLRCYKCNKNGMFESNIVTSLTLKNVNKKKNKFVIQVCRLNFS